MGEQLGASGVPGAPASANGLPEIAAAKAWAWNVELERGLRLTRPGCFPHFGENRISWE